MKDIAEAAMLVVNPLITPPPVAPEPVRSDRPALVRAAEKPPVRPTTREQFEALDESQRRLERQRRAEAMQAGREGRDARIEQHPEPIRRRDDETRRARSRRRAR
ncbi:hypothetical protein [Rathayibacter oskolensis]|uniref:hypothetical protein n=1 Tax=Rathayibacter oskolensis TaxID=1891671 RepID=UPI00101AE56C|nr:hypothetical protein [Rathayibacter oskolensis]